MIVSTQEHISKINNFIGINISDTPLNVIKTSMGNHAYLMVILALLIPVTSYLTQVLNIKLMPQATANGGDNDAMAAQMNTMNKIMPLFSLVFCFTVPVGLGIYWIISALAVSYTHLDVYKRQSVASPILTDFFYFLLAASSVLLISIKNLRYQ